MPGPPPKNPATRRRRNKASTAAALPLPAPQLAAAGPEPGGVQTGAPAAPAGLESLFAAARLASFVEGETPPLPTHRLAPAREWHHRTRAFWNDVWASPMAKNYLRADIHGLYLLAALVDDYWCTGDPALATEIRLQRQAFGLTPIDRWRLQWSVEPDRAPAGARKPLPPPAPGAAAAPDPRKVLSMAGAKR